MSERPTCVDCGLPLRLMHDYGGNPPDRTQHSPRLAAGEPPAPGLDVPRYRIKQAIGMAKSAPAWPGQRDLIALLETARNEIDALKDTEP